MEALARAASNPSLLNSAAKARRYFWESETGVRVALTPVFAVDVTRNLMGLGPGGLSYMHSVAMQLSRLASTIRLTVVTT